MKIAIVGSGVSGLVTAHLLSGEHEITLFEAEGRIGGHTCTVDAEAGGELLPGGHRLHRVQRGDLPELFSS
jgi:uncharacterized protein